MSTDTPPMHIHAGRHKDLVDELQDLARVVLNKYVPMLETCKSDLEDVSGL